MTSHKTVLTVVPSVPTPKMAVTAMNAASSPYSMRSCPSSRTIRCRIVRIARRQSMFLLRPGRRLASPPTGLGRDHQLVLDRREDVPHVRAGQRDRGGGHERDEGNQQGVLQQV